MAGKRYTPKFDGSNEVRTQVPKPPPGLYKGTVQSISLGVIKGGKEENVGQDRFSLMLEITDGKYAGARILHSLNMTKQGAPYVNDFLFSLTDGSDEEKATVIDDLWKKKRMLISESPDRWGNYPVIRIGKYIFSKGVTTHFETVDGTDNKGAERAEIKRFVLPLDDDEADSEDEDASFEDDSEDDAGDAVEVAVDDDEGDSEAVEADADDDDPWSDDE